MPNTTLIPGQHTARVLMDSGLSWGFWWRDRQVLGDAAKVLGQASPSVSRVNDFWTFP